MVNENNDDSRCEEDNICHIRIFGGEVFCVDGPPYDYLDASLLDAEPSNFHDEKLIKATSKINEILEDISKSKEGSSLSFIIFKKKALLAWVQHGVEINTKKSAEMLSDGKPLEQDSVTSDDDDETVAKALNLKNWKKS